jgi:integrase
MMILSGQRRNQVAGMRWREIDRTNSTWTVPGERMKMGRPFTLPLSSQMLALLDTLPRFSEGDHVFSTTNGKKPREAFDIMKKALDARLPDVAHWTLHDIRRSMRSTMSRLRINHDVAEACLSHDKIGLHKIYDTHDLIDEKRGAMEAWERHLLSIIAPTPDNVVRLQHA